MYAKAFCINLVILFRKSKYTIYMMGVEINLAFINSAVAANLIGFADNSYSLVRSAAELPAGRCCWLKSLAELLIEIYVAISLSQ